MSHTYGLTHYLSKKMAQNPDITIKMREAKTEGLAFSDYILYLILQEMENPPVSNDFTQDGNSFGELAVLGTLDNFDLAFITNTTEKMRLTNDGFLGLGVDPIYQYHQKGLTDDIGDNAFYLQNIDNSRNMSFTNDGKFTLL